jgi:NAD(P)-dependent dehydrogenase (short-subunit alcohol dehydrogenase family)
MPVLQDQVVLVTGAGAGIGRGTALAMAEAGAAVAAADIDLAAAQRTAAQAAGNARRAIAIEVDCGDVTSIDAMVARTVAELGRLDVIVNNAGVTRYAVRASQMRAVSSAEAVTTRSPLGSNAAAKTMSPCCSGLPIGSPVRASQMRAVVSAEAVTTRSPVGSKAAASTSSACCSGLPIGSP